MNAFRSEAADLVALVPFALAKTVPAANLLRAKSGAFSNLYMAVDRPPCDHVNVRQAMRLLVDRQEMVDVTYAGFGSVSNDVPGRCTQFYDESLVRERDIDQAKFLLKKAGKEDLTLTLQTSAVGASIPEAATLFKAQARDAGVTVELQQIDPSAYWAGYGTWTFAQTIYYPVTSLAGVWRDSIASTGGVNETRRYNSPPSERTMSLFQESKITEDETRLAESWQELQQQLFDEGSFINYGTYDYLDAVMNRVQGLNPSKYLFASGCNPRKAWLTA